jgi:histone H1/5
LKTDAEGKPGFKKTVARRVMAKKAAPRKAIAKQAAAWNAGAKKAVARKAIAKKAATYILSAPKGARTLTHRKIKQAVERVFEGRYGADA